jgi:YVTN family beta-propeller protein
MNKVTSLLFKTLLCLSNLLILTNAVGQSVVNTLNFNPPGVTNSSGILQEVAIVESTGLVYAASGSNKVSIIDPNTSAVVAVALIPTSGGIDFALVNQSTRLVYLRQPNSNIVVIDGRPTSGQFNQALASLNFPGYSIRSFALDETRGLLYVTTSTTGSQPVQGHILIVDANPANSSFHQTLHDIAMPVNSSSQGIAVNTVTNKIYLGAQGGPGGMSGIFVLNGFTFGLTRITGTVPSFEVEVDEASNLVYATSNMNRLTAVDGTTDSLLALIPMPGLIATLLNERLAINRVTSRVYVQSDEVLSPGKVIVVDGDRLSLSFNSVLAEINVGRNSNSILVDEGLNRVITASIFDFGTFGTTIIDGATNAVVGTVPANDWCFDAALNRVTHRVFTAARIFVAQKIDVASALLEATTVTGASAGFGVVNPNNHLLYTSRVVQHTDILSIDRNGTPGAIAGLPHGNGDYFLGAINKTTNRIYFSNSDADLSGLTFAAPGYVSVIDGGTSSVITNVPVGNRPFGIKANEVTNKIYVANFGGTSSLPGGITVIDGASNVPTSANVSAFPVTNRVFLDLAVNETTNKVYFWLLGGSSGVLDGTTNVATQLPASLGPVVNIRVNKVLNRIYVASRTGVLHVLDGATDAEIATLNIGAQNPTDPLAPHMVVNETTARVFIADFDNGTVTVVNGGTNSTVATISVGNGPTALALNELTNHIYVSNLTDKTVSFIDGATAAVTATLPVPIRLRSLSVDPGILRVYGVNDLTDENGGVVIIADANPPQTKNDCKNGGWQSRTDDAGQPFPNQGQCIEYFKTGT